MKKIITIVSALFIVLSSHAQRTVNEDGSIKFRGNVAIYVDCKVYQFENGKAVKFQYTETTDKLKTALRTLAISKFQDIAFGIVNRDDEANRQVQKLIEENKLEDYLDGVSICAKNQGADYLYLMDVALYSENNAAVQMEISTRLLNVENNLGYHYFYRTNAVTERNIDEMLGEFPFLLGQQLMDLFPEQYFISQVKGKKLALGAYQANGRILPSDIFYAFKFSKQTMLYGETSIPIQVLEKVAECEKPKVKNGQLFVKADNTISNTSDIVLFRNVSQIVFSGCNQIRITFFGLKNDKNSFDDMVKGRINNAMYSAITRHPGLQLIEQEHLTSLKKERELQKGEEFIDGHVVQQMKAIGANYLLKLESYHRDGAKVSMKISFISVEQNRILRTVDVVSSIDNIENEMYKQICERFNFPCIVKKIDKKHLEISSILGLTDKDDYILEVRKAVQNPTTDEVSYNAVDVCSLELETYKGNKSVMSVKKVFSKGDMKKLEDYSSKCFVNIRLDGSKIKSNTSKKTDVQREAEKTKD